jgi:hypothetical protein
MAAKIISATGTGKMTAYAKRGVSQSMYDRGSAFIAAAILLRRHANSEAHHYVVLHLLCQGIEVTLKGLLLLANYDSYQPQLKSILGHHLRKITDTALVEYRMHPLRPEIAAELDALDNLYSKHLLRYANGLVFFIDPGTIPYRRVFTRLYAVMKLVERAKRTADI